MVFGDGRQSYDLGARLSVITSVGSAQYTGAVCVASEKNRTFTIFP